MVVNLILIGIIILYLLICTAFGFLRGVTKSRIRCLTVLGAAVLSFIVSLIAKSVILSKSSSLDNWIGELELAEETAEILSALMLSNSLCEGLLGLGTALIIPIVFLAVFIVLCFITWIAHLIVTFLFKIPIKKHDEHMNHKTLQIVLLNVAQGLIVTWVVLTPINVYAQIAPSTIYALNETGALENSPELVQIADDYLEPLSNSVVKVGQPLSGPLTSFEIKGERVKLHTEVKSVASFVGSSVALGEVHITEYTHEEGKHIRDMSALFDESVLIPHVMSEVVYNSTTSWLADETFGGIERPDMGEMFNPVFIRLLQVLNQDSQRHASALQADLVTTSEMIDVLAAHKAFTNIDDNDALVKQLGEEDIVKELVQVLGKNDSMKILIPEVTNMGMRAIAMSLDINKNTEGIYNRFLADVTETLNSTKYLFGEERVSTVSAELKIAFANANVAVEETLLDAYAASMIKDLGSASNVTANDVADFFTVYAKQTSNGGTAPAAADGEHVIFLGTIYGAMSENKLAASGAATLARVSMALCAIEGDDEATISATAKEIVVNEYKILLGDTNPVVELLRNIDLTHALSNTVLENTASMKSAATMRTETVTEKDMLIDVEASAERLDALSINKEADILQTVFREAAELSDMDSELDSVDEMTEALAPILDALEHSVSVGPRKTANVLIAAMQSNKFRSNADITLSTATSIAKKATADSEKGDVDYANTMQSISSAVTLGNTMQSGSLSTEEDVDRFISTLNPTTSSMMSDYMTTERMEDYGFKDEKAELSSNLVNNMFDHLAQQEEKKESDVVAVQQLLNVATVSKDENASNEGLFGSEGRLGKNADEMIGIMVESDSVCHSLDTTLNTEEGTKVDPLGFGAQMPEGSEDRAEFMQAAEAYKTAHAGEEDALARLTLVGALFGVEI